MIGRYKPHILHVLKQTIVRLYMRIKFPNAIIEHGVEITSNSKLEGRCKLSKGSSFNGILGYGSNIGDYTKIHGKVGRFCSIAPNVNTIVGLHPYSYPYVSTSPSFYSLLKQCGFTFAKKQCATEFKYADPKCRHPVIIGNDVWIQSYVKIVSGVKIGDGAVVLAGAIVTKDVPPYAIVGGVPATILKYRFEDEDIKFLLSFKWWDKNEKWWKNNWNLLCDFNLLKHSELK